MSETFLLVDFENVREMAPSRLPEKWRVKIFIGRSQNSVPFAIASEAQRLGDRLEWIKIEGDGRNNLDFHLTFYLGELVQGFPYATFIILTKDKGFDPLLKHLSQRSIQCRRVDEFAEIATASADLPDPRFTRVCEVLSNIHKKFRPKRRKAFSSAGRRHLPAEAPGSGCETDRGSTFLPVPHRREEQGAHVPFLKSRYGRPRKEGVRRATEGFV